MPPDSPKISPQTQFGRTTFQLPATALRIRRQMSHTVSKGLCQMCTLTANAVVFRNMVYFDLTYNVIYVCKPLDTVYLNNNGRYLIITRWHAKFKPNNLFA